jgi:branched-chain amino acid transport system permease protein
LRFTEGYYLLIYATAVMVLVAVSPGGIVGIFKRLLATRGRPKPDEPAAAAALTPPRQEATP